MGPLSSMTYHHPWRWQQWRFLWTLHTFVVLPNTKPTICTPDSNFWSLCAVRERIVAVSGWLENPPLDNCNWTVQSDSDWVALSSPLSWKEKMYKHQAYAKLCILHVLRHKKLSLIIAGAPTDQTVRLHMPISSSVALNEKYIEWARIWRKLVSLREKWSIAGDFFLSLPSKLPPAPSLTSFDLLNFFLSVRLEF